LLFKLVWFQASQVNHNNYTKTILVVKLEFNGKHQFKMEDGLLNHIIFGLTMVKIYGH